MVWLSAVFSPANMTGMISGRQTFIGHIPRAPVVLNAPTERGITIRVFNTAGFKNHSSLAPDFVTLELC